MLVSGKRGRDKKDEMRKRVKKEKQGTGRKEDANSVPPILTLPIELLVHILSLTNYSPEVFQTSHAFYRIFQDLRTWKTLPPFHFNPLTLRLRPTVFGGFSALRPISEIQGVWLHKHYTSPRRSVHLEYRCYTRIIEDYSLAGLPDIEDVRICCGYVVCVNGPEASCFQADAGRLHPKPCLPAVTRSMKNFFFQQDGAVTVDTENRVHIWENPWDPLAKHWTLPPIEEEVRHGKMFFHAGLVVLHLRKSSNSAVCIINVETGDRKVVYEDEKWNEFQWLSPEELKKIGGSYRPRAEGSFLEDRRFVSPYEYLFIVRIGVHFHFVVKNYLSGSMHVLPPIFHTSRWSRERFPEFADGGVCTESRLYIFK